MATLPLARWDRRSLLAASGEDRRWMTRWSAGGSGEANNRWDRATASKVGVPWLSLSTLITSDTRPTLKGERAVPQKWDFNIRPTKQRGKDRASTQHSKTRIPAAPQTPDPFWKEKGQGHPANHGQGNETEFILPTTVKPGHPHHLRHHLHSERKKGLFLRNGTLTSCQPRRERDGTSLFYTGQ